MILILILLKTQIKMQLVTLFVLLTSLSNTVGHARWKCPAARDLHDDHQNHIPFANTGNKNGPCGPFSGAKYWGMNGVTTLKPGWMSVVWEESISHKGSPFRIALLDRSENVSIILLDHIPHWDSSKPSMMDESSYVPYKMSVYIPNVNCTQCSLQLLYIMTDKTNLCGVPSCTYYTNDSACSGHTDNSIACFGAPNNNPCRLKNTCFSNYHSCTDCRILGQHKLDNFQYTIPVQWPLSNLTNGVYKLEESNWVDGWLSSIPVEFTTPVGKCV